MDFAKHLPEVQSRLGRRINRILELKQHEGKVYFIRGAFDTNINPHLPTITKECTKISSQDAQNIRDVLYRKYPKLDCTLIIINYEEESGCDFDGLEGVIEFKVAKLDRQKRQED